MKKYLIFSFIIFLMACDSTEKLGFSESKLSKNRDKGLRREQVIANTQQRELSEHYKELGIPTNVIPNFSNFSVSEFDAKYRAFKEKYAEESMAIRTAKDRAIRIMLFDMRLLESTDKRNKALKDYYALEFVRNGGYTPNHFYQVINYLEKEKLLTDTKIQFLKSYFKGFVQEYITQKRKSIIEMQNTKDEIMKKLYKYELPIVIEQLKVYEQILKEVETWDVEPYEIPKGTYVDYRDLLK